MVGTQYEGSLLNDEPHGYGMLRTGNITYTGFFKMSKMHGLGTIMTDTYIEKGPWKNNQRDGLFRYLDISRGISYIITYENNKLLNKTPSSIQFTRESLTTTPPHIKPIYKKKKSIENHPYSIQCNICCTCECNVVIIPCGHVVACRECLEKCVNCPTCRSGILQIYNIYF